ncbi:MAG TPA: hypothetical protein VF870_12175, partial [Ignavibacteriaceae bacterium]
MFLSVSSLAQTGVNNKIANDKKYFVSDLQKQIDVLHYNLKFDLNSNDKVLKGVSTITAVKNNPNSDSEVEHEADIELNLYDNMSITSLKVNGKESEYFRNKNRVFIKANEILSDTFKIEIVYNGTPKRSGFDGFVFGEVNGQSLVYNISEPIYASTWFPCDDDPADKALLDIEITNYSQFVSVSNGNLVDVETENDKKTYHYKTEYPISTYLVAVYSAPYKTFY